MTNITRIFFRGFFSLLPITFTVYLLIWLLTSLEKVLDRLLFNNYPNLQSLPGLGLGVAAIVVFIVGLVVSSPLAPIYRLIEIPFRRVPFLKTVYIAIQDLVHYFDKSRQGNYGSVVIVSPPSTNSHFVGLLTKSDAQKISPDHLPDNLVAVFVPMSYALGGYTILVPRDWVQKIDMPVEKAMRSALTAWIERSKSPENESNQ